MNCLTVIQTSQGLANYISTQIGSSVDKRVVIGYDIRKNSKKFAELAATAFLEKGFTVCFFNDYVHTPLIPFTVQHLAAAAGVMITASHNPAYDNGYKVYWGPSGCQINSPHDVGIARSILQEDSLKPISWNTTDLSHNLHFEVMTASVLENYYEAVSRLVRWRKDIQTPTRFVYTPLHGTGLKYMEKLARKLGFLDNMVVAEAQVMILLT